MLPFTSGTVQSTWAEIAVTMETVTMKLGSTIKAPPEERGGGGEKEIEHAMQYRCTVCTCTGTCTGISSDYMYRTLCIMYMYSIMGLVLLIAN